MNTVGSCHQWSFVIIKMHHQNNYSSKENIHNLTNIYSFTLFICNICICYDHGPPSSFLLLESDEPPTMTTSSRVSQARESSILICVPDHQLRTFHSIPKACIPMLYQYLLQNNVRDTIQKCLLEPYSVIATYFG